MSVDDLLADLQKGYIQSFPEKVQRILGFLDKGEIALLQGEFHKLKGTGKTYGVKEVSVLAAAAEKICASQTSEVEWVTRLATNILLKIQKSYDGVKDFNLDTDSDFVRIKMLADKVS